MIRFWHGVWLGIHNPFVPNDGQQEAFATMKPETHETMVNYIIFLHPNQIVRHSIIVIYKKNTSIYTKATVKASGCAIYKDEFGISRELVVELFNAKLKSQVDQFNNKFSADSKFIFINSTSGSLDSCLGIYTSIFL